MMTEAEAWRVIAEAFAVQPYGILAQSGLCSALWELRWDGLIDSETRDMMRNRVQSYLGEEDKWAYETDEWGGTRGSDRPARCLAALWLAEEAEAES